MIKAVRYRTQPRAFRAPVLVLQVCERRMHTYCIGGYIDTDWVEEWRDARVEDLPALAIDARSGETRSGSTGTAKARPEGERPETGGTHE